MAEQTVIAEVLSEQHKELAALEARLARPALIKPSMIQSLPTGYIRLV